MVATSTWSRALVSGEVLLATGWLIVVFAAISAHLAPRLEAIAIRRRPPEQENAGPASRSRDTPSGFAHETKRLTFLLGAGVSLPAGLPSTAEITTRVLQVHPVSRHSDGSYILDQEDAFSNENSYVKRIPRYLAWLKGAADEFFKQTPARPTNYEDILYLLSQVHDTLVPEYENPALQPFVEKIKTELSDLFVSGGGTDFQDVWHVDIAGECRFYLIDAVAQLLSRNKSRSDHLTCVVDACMDKSLGCLDIITLNHDVLIERALQSASIRFSDGFSGPVGQARLWNPDSYRSERVCLFKPHGSINWYRVAVKHRGRYRKTVTNDIQDIGIAEEPHPLILGGTFNKMLSYSGGIFSDVLYYMRGAMEQSKRLILSGYSFGDKGINSRLIDWLEDQDDRRLIVLHEKPEDLFQGARGAIRNHWNDWRASRRMIVLHRWLCDTTYEELIRASSDC